MKKTFSDSCKLLEQKSLVLLWIYFQTWHIDTLFVFHKIIKNEVILSGYWS